MPMHSSFAVAVVACTPVHIGVGVVQGYSPKLGDNTVWIVCVFGRR